MKERSIQQIAQDLDCTHPSCARVGGVAIDSRLVKPGDLFFALPGNRVDGHHFIDEVAQKGAVGCVVQEGYVGDTTLPLIRVPDVLVALQEVARKELLSRKSQVIAITGTVGKTTTKEFVHTLLSKKHKVFASPRSYNSQSTVPLSILMAEGDEEYLILEMGMSEKGNIENLISIAPPDLALITAVGVQHATLFTDGIAGIRREKAMIFTHPKTRYGIVNHDIECREEVLSCGRCDKQTFSSKDRSADAYFERCAGGMIVELKGEDPQRIAIDLPHRGHFQNLLAAILLARTLELSWEEIHERVPLLKLPPMRFERVEKRGVVFVNDAYNANPDAMELALENLPRPEGSGKTWAVLGDMDALGSYSEGAHAQIASLAEKKVDRVLYIGSRWERRESCATKEEVIKVLQDSLSSGDVVLLKGARSHALDEILKLF